MIWGKTYKEQKIHRQTKWFAWYPVQLKDGRWCWLECVWRFEHLNSYTYHIIPADCPDFI